MIDPAEDGVARLLRETGRRPPAPAERASRVESVVRERWRAGVAARRRASAFRWAAAAAALILAMATWWGFRGRPAPTPTEVATVERGSATAADNVAGGLRVGSVVATRPGERIALRTASRHSVRLNTASRLRLVSGRRVALEAGSVYVDSGEAAGTVTPLVVETPLGTLSDVGTQFEARLSDGALEIRVRSGHVAVEAGSGRMTLSAGEAWRLDGNGLRSAGTVATFDPAWAWAEEAAPRMAIDGRTLEAFLTWFSRERGLTIRFADAELARAAERTRLHGSIEALTLDEALESVLRTSGLTSRGLGAELLVERR